jgi:hypothetical protein
MAVKVLHAGPRRARHFVRLDVPSTAVKLAMIVADVARGPSRSGISIATEL